MLYCIQIIPPEPAFTLLQNTINELAEKCQGVVFKPHITVLGKIDADLSQVETKTKHIVASINSLKLSFGPVSFSTTYFQSVFVRINSTASLLQLNLDAKTAFSIENNVFMPHISLLYGDHAMTIREKVASEIQLPATSFVVNSVVIVPDTPNPQEWEPVATIQFKN